MEALAIYSLVRHMKFELLAILLAISLGIGRAQTSANARPEFEVVSVKPLNADVRGGRPRLNCAGGGPMTSGIPLKYVIEWAFDLRTEFSVPDWAGEGGERYDIEAKAEGPVSEAQCKLMTRSLLEDRFRLKSHRETRETALFYLEVGKGGSKLAPVKPWAPLGEGVWLRGHKTSEKGWEAWMIAATLQSLPGVGRPVVDRTGLRGEFEFRLDYAVRPDEDRPDILKAVQEQLGLKLAPAKGPVEFFVVDRLERPSEN
jgi:uncharacterized protein (TIGR03435 family)